MKIFLFLLLSFASLVCTRAALTYGAGLFVICETPDGRMEPRLYVEKFKPRIRYRLNSNCSLTAIPARNHFDHMGKWPTPNGETFPGILHVFEYQLGCKHNQIVGIEVQVNNGKWLPWDTCYMHREALVFLMESDVGVWRRHKIPPGVDH